MSNAQYIKSISKAVTILKIFTAQEPELTLAQIARKARMHKSTAHRILATLVRDGLICKDMVSDKYSIGHTLFTLGSLYLETAQLIRSIEPVIDELNELTGESILASVLEGCNITIIAKRETRNAFKFSTNVGTVIPAYTTAQGKILLSELSEKELDRLVPYEKLFQFTPQSIPTKAELKSQLEQVRKAKVAYSFEEYLIGAVGIASGIRDDSGKYVAAIGIATLPSKSNEEYTFHLAALIKIGASFISYQLGYRGEADSISDIKMIRSWWENLSDVVSSARG